MAKAPAEIRSLARKHTGAALRTLSHIMSEPKAPAAARVAAAQALLDRGWGKATQPIAGEDGKPIEISQVTRTIIDPNAGHSDR